jgi:Pectate lyase superfamily protein/Carbohydrate binding module (family 6)/F5/8 type C domain/Abnormal spindle-like microcephaly-assoc'd, ASPM-SPD-2-Hydin/Fibronectin type III domain
MTGFTQYVRNFPLTADPLWRDFGPMPQLCCRLRRFNKMVAPSYISFLLIMLLGVVPFAYGQTPGAPVPFTEFNAVTSSGVQTNGTVIGPNINFGTLASEATGREAIVLSGQGKYIQFTLTAPANAVTIHYAIPDAPAGGGITEPLSLYANGTLATSLSLTSAYSWLYGAYTFSKTPSLGMPGDLAPHDFYNDVRYKFSSTLAAGTVVKLQVDPGDNSPWYIINTADFEVVPAAIAQPSGSINAVTSYGADNTGVKDSTTALQNAINAAENATTPGTVYLPAGTYTISNPLSVNNVTVEGAGEWYTVITGSHVEFAGNISPASTKVNVSNLAIFGNVAVRNDSDGTVNGFNGGFSNSTISNVWIQNTKVGAWIVGPATNLTFDNMRIMDLKADGINFNAANGAISGGTVENSFFQNTQDDGVAMWAENAADTNITVNQNTILSPGLANNIAVYGAGQGDEITNNLLEDPVTRGSCFQTSQGVFSSVASSGPVTIQNNVMQRCGVFDPGFFFGTGAVRFWPASSALTGPFNLSGNTIENSAYAAYQFLGPSTNPTVTVDGDTVTNVGTFVVHAQGPGTATFTDVTASGVTDGGFLNLGGDSGFTVDTSGDVGWSASPAATAIPPGNPLWVYPDIVTFQTTEGTALTEQVAVINAAYQTTTIGAISTSSGFTQTNNCGTSLAAAEYGGASEPGYCIVNVTFNGGGSGITSGTLTIPNSAGNTVNVLLVGSTGGNTTITPPQVSPTSLSFGYLLVGQTAPAQTVTLTNPAGSAALSISSIETNAGFTQTDTCGSVLAGGASCTISVKFTPTAAGTFSGSLAITTSASSAPIGVSLSGTAYASTTNLALGATATASSNESGFPASNANDGNTSTYWESLDGAGYPQTLTLNFGQVLPLGSVTLTLPPLSDWATRTETLSVLGSNNGTSWTTIVASAGYTFNPSTTPPNTVSFNLPAGTSYQYLQLSFTANTGWTAAQVSEFEVFPGTTTCTTPAAPSALSATAVSSSQINLSWTASSTSGVTYSVFRSTTSGFTASASNQVTSGLTATTYSDTGLAASTTYYYLVQAVSSCASSASSNQASATTPAPVSATITASTTSLAFGNLSVGSSSAAQTVTLKNTGNIAATISSITAGTGFTETNTCGSSLAAGASCTVSVTFTPAAASSYSASLTVNSNATDATLTVALAGTGGSSTTNLALSATATASSNASGFPASNVNDGNTSTYWESLDGAAYPQTLTLNFGKVESLGSVTLTLPPSTAWTTRTETLSVLGSTNGTTWTTLVPSASYTFNPSTTPSNTVSFNLPAGTSEQYLELSFTANTGWPAAQISEFEVYAGTTGSGEAPYGGTAAAVPGTVHAENYDTGGQGVAYNVTSVNGTDNSYRSDGVDLETATSPATGNDLGWTASGQWFKYTVDVATAGTYTVSFLVAAPSAVTDAFHITNSSGTNLTGSVNIPATGGFQTWTTVTATVTLPAGLQVLTLNEDHAGWNIDTATFALANAPFGGTAAAIPGIVLAENYDTGGQGVAYNVTSVNGTDNIYRSDGVDLETATSPATGNDLGWTAAEQWFKYTVNVATAGNYTITFEVASPSGVSDAFHISRSSGTNLSGSVNVAETGGWQTWTTVTATVTLPAGLQVFALNEDNAGWNIDASTFAVQ